MKLLRSNRFLTAINTAVADALNSVSGVWDEISLADGEKEARYRLAPYGEFPVTIDGKTAIQVIDRQAAEAIASNAKSLGSQLAMFFKGIPVFEGHADDAIWMRDNPGHKPVAVGRIKDIEAGEDGIYVRTVFNSTGVSLLGGSAPHYSGHSPRWRMTELPDRPGHYRPFLLWSDALTNNPNLPDSTIALNSLALGDAPAVVDPAPEDSPSAAASAPAETENQDNDNMKLTADALKALGFAPDAAPSQDELSAAIVRQHSAAATAEANLTAANTRTTNLQTELEAVRGAAVDTVISAAIADGRITEADKPRWTDALNTSFATESEKLAKLMPSINTANQVAGLGERKLEGAPAGDGIDAINSAVTQIAKDHGYDMGTKHGYDAAWAKARELKPELFKRG